MIGDYPRRAGASSDAGEMDLIPVGRILFSSCLCGVMLCCVVGTSVSVVLRIAFAKAVRNGPRPGSLSPKRPEMDLAPGYFRQSNPKWTSPRITFAKAARNGPRPGLLSPKQFEMDLAPDHFRQSNPKWTSPRVTFAKATRNGPRLGSLSPKQPEMDLAPGHFRQNNPKWTSKSICNPPKPPLRGEIWKDSVVSAAGASPL